MRSEAAAVKLLLGFAVAALVGRLVLIAGADPFMDEAYYWLWGQHPGLSYFDHPSLVGWSAAFSGSLFGWNLFALRLPVLLTTAGDLLILWLFARRMSPAAPLPGFALSAVLLLATPVFFALSVVALPDHLLIFFSLLSLYGFYRFLETADVPQWRWLVLGALALGMAALAKYNAGLIGLGFALTLLIGPRFRPLLLRPQVYLAALLAISLQLPVLLWNAENGWASLRFITGGRAGLAQGDLSGLTGFLLTILAFLGPFLLWPAARFLFARRRPTAEADAALLFRVVALVSTFAWLCASLFTNILFHWNLVAYVALIPVVGAWLGTGRQFFLHMAYCGLAIVLAIVNYSLVPVTAFSGRADQTSAWTFGWDEVAQAVEAARAEHSVGFVAATDYALAAPLAFALRDKHVTSLDTDTDQFDFWFDTAAHEGQTALIVSDGWRPLEGPVASRFAKLTPLGDVTVTRFGQTVNTYRLTLGEGFAALAANGAQGL